MTTTIQITPCPHDNHNSNYFLSTWQRQLKLLPVHMTTITQTTSCPHDSHNSSYSLCTWQPQPKLVPFHMTTQIKSVPVHMTTTIQITPCPHDNYNLHHSLSTCLLQLKSVPVHMSTTTGLKLTHLFAYLSHRGVMACGAVHFLSQVTAAWNNTATAFKGVYSLLYTVRWSHTHQDAYAATLSQSIALKWTLQKQMVLSSKLVHNF